MGEVVEFKNPKTVSILGVFDGQKWRTEEYLPNYIIQQGYKVKTYNFRGQINLDELNNPTNQDFVLVLNGIGINPILIKDIKNPLILWNCELFNGWNDMNDVAMSNFQQIKDTAHLYDHIIVHDKLSIPAFQTLTNQPISQIYGYGFREGYHVTRPKNKQPTKDIGFLGSLAHHRKSIVDKLNKDLKQYNLKIDMYDFEPDPFKYRDFIWDHKVMLNIHYTKDLNTEHRIVECLCLDTPVISQEVSMPEMFEGFTQYLRTQGNETILAEEIYSYLKVLTNDRAKMSPLDKNKLPKYKDLIAQVMGVCENTKVHSPKHIKPAKPVSIAAVMIVKDVSSVLDRCLSSLKAVPGVIDNIYILDTGSSMTCDCKKCNIISTVYNKVDKCPSCGSNRITVKCPTLEVAKKYTDNIRTDFKFDDHLVKIKDLKYGFGQARNAAKENVKEDWILSIDADEWIEPTILKTLKEKVSEYNHWGAFKVTVNLLMNPDDKGVSVHRFPTDRIFRNDKRSNWINYVHNEFAVDQMFGVMDSGITISHSRDTMSQHDSHQRGFQRWLFNMKALRKEEMDRIIAKGDITRSLLYRGNTCLDHLLPKASLRFYNKFLQKTPLGDARRGNIYLSMAQCYAQMCDPQVRMVKCKTCGAIKKTDHTKPQIRCRKCDSRDLEFFTESSKIDHVTFQRLMANNIHYLSMAVGSNLYDPSQYVMLAQSQMSVNAIQPADWTLKLAESLTGQIPEEYIQYPMAMGNMARLRIENLAMQNKFNEAISIIDTLLNQFPNEKWLIEKKAELSKFLVQSNFVVKKDRKQLTIFSPQHTFISDTLDRWSKENKYTTNLVTTNYWQIPNPDAMKEVFSKSDIVWFEFGNEALVEGSKILATMNPKPKVITRIHGYELYHNFLSQVNWSAVDDVIFVAQYLADMGTKQAPELKNKRVHIVHGGINLDKFTIDTINKKGNKICFAGFINDKKDLSTGVLIFNELLKIQPDLEYHIAGTVQDPRLFSNLQYQIKSLGLEDKVFFYPWQEDLNKWYADKDYFLSSSKEESLCYSLAQSMSSGLLPIIRDWESSEEFYSTEWIYTTVDEAKEIFGICNHIIQRDNITQRDKMRKYIQDNLSLEKQNKRLEEIING